MIVLSKNQTENCLLLFCWGLFGGRGRKWQRCQKNDIRVQRVKSLSTSASCLGLKKREVTLWNSLAGWIPHPWVPAACSTATKLLSRQLFWSLAARVTLSSETVCSFLCPKESWLVLRQMWRGEENTEYYFPNIIFLGKLDLEHRFMIPPKWMMQRSSISDSTQKCFYSHPIKLFTNISH